MHQEYCCIGNEAEIEYQGQSQPVTHTQGNMCEKACCSQVQRKAALSSHDRSDGGKRFVNRTKLDPKPELSTKFLVLLTTISTFVPQTTADALTAT